MINLSRNHKDFSEDLLNLMTVIRKRRIKYSYANFASRWFKGTLKAKYPRCFQSTLRYPSQKKNTVLDQIFSADRELEQPFIMSCLADAIAKN